MELSLEGAKFIIKHEGFKSKPYLDSRGIPTIGNGSTHYLDGTAVTLDDAPINADTALELLQHHIDKEVIAYIEEIQPLNNLSQNKVDAILSLTYNIGCGAFKDSSLLKAIQANSTDDIIRQKFMLWTKAGGKELAGLVNRRNDEANLYINGTY